MPSTLNRQTLTADTVLLPARNNRYGNDMISETVGSTTTLWAVDLLQDAKDDKKGAQVHVYTVTTGAPTKTASITLPSVESAGSTNWDKSIHRELETLSVFGLRMQGNFIWAADYTNGTVYRFSKTAADGTPADIVFFKPTKSGTSGGEDEIPLQYNDIAFQPKGGAVTHDRLWLGDGNTKTSNIYCVDLPNGFGGAYSTAINDFTNKTPMDVVLANNPAEFFDLLCHGTDLWILCKDKSDGGKGKNGIIHGTAGDDGSVKSAAFYPVEQAATMVADLTTSGKEGLYIGADDGSLFRKDISAAGKTAAATKIHGADGDFAHYQMFLDKAGYIWSTANDNGKVNCYSPEGTLSRRYTVKSAAASPSWVSPISLHDGKRVAVLDTGSKMLGIFTVDDAFVMGDFDLKFEPAVKTFTVNDSVSTLPLQALDHSSHSPITSATSATLKESDSDNGNTFKLTNNSLVVDIAANASSVTLADPAKAGSKQADATVTAEARTTGIKKATLTVHVQPHKLKITPKDDPNNNHAHKDGKGAITGFDVRQAKNNKLPDVTIEAAAGDATVNIKNSTSPDVTLAEFVVKNKPQPTQQVVASANGKPVPEIAGGSTVGTATLTLTQGSSTSTEVPMHILPLADNVVPSNVVAATTPAKILESNNNQLKLQTKGHTVYPGKGAVVSAPKTLIKIKLTTHSNDQKLYFVYNGVKKAWNDEVTLLSDADGQVSLKDNKLVITHDDVVNFEVKQAYFEVSYDTSGQMAYVPAAAIWGPAVKIKFPQR
ncbi:hypothetical protein SAMN03159353_104311 [Cedecea sp. NFIX57]|nr:hypothetical protein SAMN03159353_104311 [Cedecea sp. NFIX57]